MTGHTNERLSNGNGSGNSQFFFARKDVSQLKLFWLAKLASGAGKCGGVSRGLSLSASERNQLDENAFPNCDEAKWHLESRLSQFHSMNEKQRMRQSQFS